MKQPKIMRSTNRIFSRSKRKERDTGSPNSEVTVKKL
ncbi:hypothetical protein DH86_00002573 [Scytalidium sp. 3C]|nr:hypothetical protein DH86_00002573 [Scytalidium sp. 3C]